MNEFNQQIPIQPMPYIPQPPLKSLIKKCYNWSCAALLFQFLIANTITIIATMIIMIPKAIEFTLAGVTDPAEMTELLNGVISPTALIVINAIAFLVANPVSYLISNAATKRTLKAKIFGKIRLSAADSVLFVVSILGLQGLSMMIQMVVMNLTKTSGINETTASMMSFSDDIFKNVVIVIYFVFIAAITEELLCRGMVMKLLSPANKTFALIASSLLFGIMHGNFNQMFNGFLLGLVLGYAAMKSKSILLPIICHMAANTNAMVLSFLEYKLGEKAVSIEMIYSVVLIVIGIISVILLLKRNGRINESEDGFEVEYAPFVPDEERKNFTWKLLIQSPCFWIFVVIYIITAITMVTSIA